MRLVFIEEITECEDDPANSYQVPVYGIYSDIGNSIGVFEDHRNGYGVSTWLINGVRNGTDYFMEEVEKLKKQHLIEACPSLNNRIRRQTEVANCLTYYADLASQEN